MLRLRPSEITLTQADVDETRRRMARRRAMVPHRGSVASDPLMNRQRPVHLGNHAVVRLGEIPLLCPRQVDASPTSSALARTSISADIVEEHQPNVDDPSTRISGPSTVTTSTQEESQLGTDLLSPIRNLQLQPFSLDVPRESDTPSPQPEEASSHSNGLEEFNGVTPSSQIHDSIDGSVEDSFTTAHSASISQEINRQDGTISASDCHPVDIVSSHHNQSGICVSPHHRTFRSIPPLPHTEPRRRPGRWNLPKRPISSGSEPSTFLATTSLGQSSSISVDYASYNPDVHSRNFQHDERNSSTFQSGSRATFDERLQRAHRRIESIEGRYQLFFHRRRRNVKHDNHDHSAKQRGLEAIQRVSGASISSRPYSYYELPSSQHSSGSFSQDGEPSIIPQYDGAAESMYSVLSPRASPDSPIASSKSAPSPLPETPYARVKEALTNPQISVITASRESSTATDSDAASAAIQDLPSPLDLLEHAATSQFLQFSQVIQMNDTRDTSNSHATLLDQLNEESEDLGLHNGVNSNGQRTLPEAGNNTQYQPFVTRGGNEPPRRTARQVPSGSIIQPRRRAVPSIRVDQRSSENAPLGFSSREDHHIARDPSQTFGINDPLSGARNTMRQSAMPSQISLQQATLLRNPRDNSSRSLIWPDTRGRRARTSYNFEHSDRHYGDRHYSGSPRSMRRSTRDFPYPDPVFGGPEPFVEDFQPPNQYAYNTRNGYQRRASGALILPEAQQRRQQRPLSHSRAFDHFRTHRGSYSASAEGGRRPDIPMRVASRHQVSAQQSNQENSGEAEAILMRNEMATAGMRYSNLGGQSDTMDDTPPRIGRFEQRMLGN
ncbi:hypothetical protein BU24DRAFT_403882 [Aaosphaeria arxii CBS 175.79]|uniref:Uncharacterized protein n=1 Tax=Aaosphaeria arxii CBS 175.79 TaxID=1450172 RepID=A0A6A5Y7M9_9PLEO|nr:uncharacterized protein BU24DRAFT_403882 [Aaosphaeria arxii CBS 175.79]KAF2020810.1 hypothetical protein BU24DRAFT_403882 [Aaosphaeria arxii CBS 175.79]